MDHQAQHHQQHQKEREEKNRHDKEREDQEERQVRKMHPAWFMVLGIFLIGLVILTWIMAAA
ncbi:hypothetical protein BH10PLA2_BH10PLA2_22400 [soil metagenome]